MEMYKKIIEENVTNVKNIELVSESSNMVFKIVKNDGEILFAKFYLNNSSHIDNELKLYDLVDNKLLKEIYYISISENFAIFKELKGKTIDELTEEELKKQCKNIIDSLILFFNTVSKNKTSGYGILDKNLNGKYNNFIDFLKQRQRETSNELREYKLLSEIGNLIFEKYEDIIFSDNSLVPIDNNLKNIMLTENDEIKFIDPGEMIGGPILMAYGDFVAHTYKTCLYDHLIEKLNLNETDEKLLRIYAIFSSLNILAFLNKLGIKELTTVIPYGNKITFYKLILEHLKKLGINYNNKGYI